MHALLARKRVLLPLVGACICLFAASFASPLLGWLLIMAAFGLLLDICTAWFAKAGGTGGMRDYKQ